MRTPSRIAPPFLVITCLAVLAALSGCAGQSPAPATAAHPPASGPAEKVTLALALEPGAVYKQELSQTQELPTGQKLATTAHVRTYVEDAGDGVFTLEDRYEDVSISVNGKEVAADELKELSGVRIRYQMDSRGRLVGKPTAEGTNEKNREVAEELAQSVSEASVPFPDHPVAVGDSWKASRAVEMPTGMGQLSGEITETHTLERIEEDHGRRVAVISMSGEMKLEPLEAGKVSLRGSGSLDGEQRVLLSDGFSGRTKSVATLHIEGTAGKPPKRFAGEQKTSTQVRIERADVPGAGEMGGGR